jgi:PhnB protein
MELTPYIMFDSNCEEALGFYAKAMDGKIIDIMRFGDMPGENPMSDAEKKKVMHSHFEAANVKFMASDNPMGGAGKGGQVHLSLHFEDGGRQEKVFNALAEGGTVTMPLQDTFWGARFGMLQDKYGINWMFNKENR